MKIAVVQQAHNPGQVARNREKAVEAARQALRQNAELILFHEELLVGYHKNARELAEPLDGETSRAFSQVLRGTNACVVYGLTERLGEDRYISAPVVTAHGVQTVYRKTHLWRATPGLRDESALYKPGNELVTFRHQGALIGLMICFDGDFGEMFRSYAKLGCDVVLWMNNRPSRGPEDGVRLHAKQNSLYVAASCCCGVDELGAHCPGGSNICDCTGRVLSEIWDQEGTIYATIDPAQAKLLRPDNPFFRDRREALYLVKDIR